MDSLSTRHIIDLAIVGAALLLGVAGFWRGVAKEVFISAGALLGYSLALEWSARWGGWIGDVTRLSSREGTFAAAVAMLIAGSILVGYFGCAVASLPPADGPGRLGGFILGATNAVFVVAVLLDWAQRLVLHPERAETLRTTEVGRRLSAGSDWVLLAVAGVAWILVLGAWQVRKRRRPIVSVGGAPRPGESGFQLRRDAPLAPEPEKLERPAASTWSIPATFAETAPLTRVADPSARTDRQVVDGALVEAPSGYERTEVALRCPSCAERIGGEDRYCLRCGRQLI